MWSCQVLQGKSNCLQQLVPLTSRGDCERGTPLYDLHLPLIRWAFLKGLVLGLKNKIISYLIFLIHIKPKIAQLFLQCLALHLLKKKKVPCL